MYSMYNKQNLMYSKQTLSNIWEKLRRYLR